jgi:hypothetical protein
MLCWNIASILIRPDPDIGQHLWLMNGIRQLLRNQRVVEL